MPHKWDWKPRRRGLIYCSPSCGGDCTFAAFEEATKAAAKLAARLGPAWKPRVWENQGWHYQVTVANLWVSASIAPRRFVAAIGMHSEYGRTPRAAVRAVLKAATADLRELQAALQAAELPGSPNRLLSVKVAD